jgi:hypothetical protein
VEDGSVGDGVMVLLELQRGQVAQAAMGAHGVVVLSPCLDDDARRVTRPRMQAATAATPVATHLLSIGPSAPPNAYRTAASDTAPIAVRAEMRAPCGFPPAYACLPIQEGDRRARRAHSLVGRTVHVPRFNRRRPTTCTTSRGDRAPSNECLPKRSPDLVIGQADGDPYRALTRA